MGRPSFSISFVIAAVLLGCSSDPPSVGAAPSLKDMVITPTSVDVGKVAQLSGSATAEDVDGDLDSISVTVALPNGQPSALPAQKIANAAGQKSAPIQFLVALQAPVAGEYTLSVSITDKAGNESPKLAVKLTAK